MGTILVVDDEKGIVELIDEALTRFGHTVEVATDGLSALRLFKNGLFDLVITDMSMPNIDGPTLVRHIRRSNHPDIPVIGISGTPWELKKANCDVTFTKPFSLIQLIHTVNQFVRETDPSITRQTPFSVPLEARQL